MNAAAETMARRELERQLIADGTAIWRAKKELQAELDCEDRRELRDMLSTYHPWGKPGNGAPMPGALRKSKLILEQNAAAAEFTPTSVMTLGRPGHGAPLRTKSGKTKTLIKADPAIRFQFHESSRRSVDNDLRYRSSPMDKENYRKQLDAIVFEKSRTRNADGVGAPKLERKKGWTNEVMLKRLERDLPPPATAAAPGSNEHEQVFEISGGVELVPLLAKHRIVHRCPLSTTDVTRMSKVPNGPTSMAVPERMYHRELSNQVDLRQQMIQDARREDLESSQKHFETWKGFWGRPGHGAPKGPGVGREKLEVILYHIPAQASATCIH